MSQIISALGLWLFPTIAMVIFLVVFMATMAWHLHPSRRPEHARASSLPLEDDRPNGQTASEPVCTAARTDTCNTIRDTIRKGETR